MMRKSCGGRAYWGLVSLPDPAAELEHEQAGSVLGLLLPEVAGLAYGDAVEVELWDGQVGVVRVWLALNLPIRLWPVLVASLAW